MNTVIIVRTQRARDIAMAALKQAGESYEGYDTPLDFDDLQGALDRANEAATLRHLEELERRGIAERVGADKWQLTEKGIAEAPEVAAALRASGALPRRRRP